MPVLRVAVAEPGVFEVRWEHPARQCWIDCMGSCALGFDVTVEGDSGWSFLKSSKAVQHIEQYPETGRVFQLVYEEFDKLFCLAFFAEQAAWRGRSVWLSSWSKRKR
jgi:hypothetical protein